MPATSKSRLEVCLTTCGPGRSYRKLSRQQTSNRLATPWKFFGRQGSTCEPPLPNQLQTVTEYIKIGQDEGARLLVGGRALQGPEYHGGYFVEPTVFDGVHSDVPFDHC